MSETEAGSEIHPSTGRKHGKQQLWDEDKLKEQRGDFYRWIGLFPTSFGTNTEPASVQSADAITGSTEDTSAANSGNTRFGDTYISIADSQRIFVPRDKYCGLWHDSPNKERHASFGDHGTTASANCFGDLMQMSQYLGVGRSGIFTIDQSSTREPYFVVQRASDLDNLARAKSDGFSFGLCLPEEYVADEANLPDVKWVNWRWPRYEYHARNNKSIEACSQFMTHGGVVLQQFTLENTDDKPVEVGPFEIESTVRIRDLDFLKSYDETEESHRLGPNGYGHVCVRLLPNGCQGHAVASVSTTFVNGSAVKFNGQDGNNSTFLDKFELGGSTSTRNKVEIVIARKLLVLPKGPSDWRNFVISAQDSDINHWLREEEEKWHEDDEQTTPCLATLAMTKSKSTNTVAARVGTDPSGGNKEAAAPNRSEYDESSSTGANLPRDWEFFNMPSGTSNPSENWNPKDHLEYFAWRHLEHILCVCAIPLSPLGLVEVSASRGVKLPVLESSPPVALTCGDISGHRISTAASFFAFKFLVDVGRRLRLLQPKTKYTRDLETRIENVCSGHVRWLEKIRTTESVLSTKSADQPPWNDEDISNEHMIRVGCFAANYWVTGKVMTRDSPSWQPQNRITDTAFHILKLAEYSKLDLDSKEDIAQKVMDDIYVPWLTELDRLDVRKTCSWPHSNTDGIIKFRLDDHFWIWKALSCLDTDIRKIRLAPLVKTRLTKEEKHEDPRESPIQSLNDVTRRLSPKNVQRTVLQLFTAENDGLKPGKTMLAVTRSAMDVRFLLHARDTALLHGEDCGFFPPNSSFRQLWKNTVDAQCHYDGNMYTDSDNTLRYALAIAMGIRGYTLDSPSSAFDLVKKYIEILVDMSGSDAFFPGQLDGIAREPTTFIEEEDRDRFYHTDFEINYILLSNASKIVSLFCKMQNNSTVDSFGQYPPPVAAIPELRRQPGQAGMSRISANKDPGLQVISAMNNMSRGPDGQPEVAMKKSLPFTNAIPATNVNHVGDEWLYRYPDFLRGQKLEIETSERDEVVHRYLRGKLAAMRPHSDFKDSASDFEAVSRSSRLAFYIVDIRKGKPYQRHNMTPGPWEKATQYKIASIKGLRNCLQEPRTAWTAKKRIIWLPHANYEAVSTFFAASSERERQELSQFFDRHTAYAKDVRDKTSLVSNIWQTELYLSFFLLVETDNTSEIWATCGLPHRDNNSVPFPGLTGLEIRRASISFRFDGDFFDRFWTCHFVEHLPTDRFRGHWDHSFNIRDGDLDKQWMQRKVLELDFLNRILGKIDDESKNFPRKVQEILGIESSSLALASLNPVKGSIKDLHRFEKMLQLVEDDIAANLDTLRKKWNRREADRGQEKPRWTANAEKKYRASINRLSVQVERATGSLKDTQDDIRKLKEFLAITREFLATIREHEKAQEAAEKDRKDANIRYLTYVTVIFQPLGFAASFHSMSGAPEPALVVSLVKLSAAAFAVTLVLIWGYRAIASRDDEDGVLQKFSRKSIRQYEDSKEAWRKHRYSPRVVVHLTRGVIELIARYFLQALRWCWVLVYEWRRRGMDSQSSAGAKSEKSSTTSDATNV